MDCFNVGWSFMINQTKATLHTFLLITLIGLSVGILFINAGAV